MVEDVVRPVDDDFWASVEELQMAAHVSVATPRLGYCVKTRKL
jgi:hypothetical protein